MISKFFDQELAPWFVTEKKANATKFYCMSSRRHIDLVIGYLDRIMVSSPLLFLGRSPSSCHHISQSIIVSLFSSLSLSLSLCCSLWCSILHTVSLSLSVLLLLTAVCLCLFSGPGACFPPRLVMIFSLRASLLRNLRSTHEKVAGGGEEEQVNTVIRSCGCKKSLFFFIFVQHINICKLRFNFLFFLLFSFFLGQKPFHLFSSYIQFFLHSIFGFPVFFSFFLGFSFQPFPPPFLSMSQPRQFPVGGSNGGGQFGDTTYTKIFVGGLAWETHRETMRRYFEQFGEILEAVVITDKNSGRSKGYGFVSSFQHLLSLFVNPCHLCLICACFVQKTWWVQRLHSRTQMRPGGHARILRL